jgi:DNA-binding transcriptional LysR family regulator
MCGNQLDWNDLKLVLAIHRTGNLKGAAQALGINQSTASRRLTAFESDLGAILFVRARSGYSLTDAGEATARHAQKIERQIMLFEDDLQSAGQGPTGLVRIVTNAWINSHILIPKLPEFLDTHPQLRVHLIGETSGRNLSKREAEIALWFERAARDQEISFDLGQVGYAVYARKDADIDNIGWVSFWDDTANRAPMRWLEDHSEMDGLRMTSTDASAVYAAVKTGIGKALIPMCIAGSDPALACQSDEPPEMARTLKAIVHPDIINMPRISAVIEWLHGVFCEDYSGLS